MGFIQDFINNRKEKLARQTQACEELLELARQSICQLDPIIKAHDQYFDIAVLQQWKEEHKNLYSRIMGVGKEFKKPVVRRFKDSYGKFLSFFNDVELLRQTHNQSYLNTQEKTYEQLFANIEGRALDKQQRECAIRDDTNILVVAGAGTGKTTTIVGKVKYLLEAGKATAGELLVLSFTNASAAEMAERLKKETSQNIDVMTFHKLGLSIISEAEGTKPGITNIELYKFVKEEFATLLGQASFMKLFMEFFVSYLKQYKSEFDYENESEYMEYAKQISMTTLKGEKVKSFEEMEIANFLLLHGVKYEYEQKYEKETATLEFGQYKPDFYLPDFRIYIEHFGVNRSGQVPKYFKSKENKSAAQVYKEGMEWKRKTHKENKTILVETYSYEKIEGTLITGLRSKLEAKGVVFREISRDEMLELMKKEEKSDLDGLFELMATFINLARPNTYLLQDLHRINNEKYLGYEKLRNGIFLSLIEPFFLAYDKSLELQKEVDFNDMINKATSLVRAGKCNRQYKYIIIDEYQDISKSRYELVKALREKSKAKIFCVGDDWQSIYRFAGSDINFFLEFQKYWGFTQQCLIETTYRFKSSMIEVSEGFVIKNPFQIRKKLKSNNLDNSFSTGMVNCSNGFFVSQDLEKRLDTLPSGSSVYFIGRYNSDVNEITKQNIQCKFDSHNCRYQLKYSRRPDLLMEFLTAHRSKGLQADYVFVVNNKKGRYGFPSDIQDDSVLGLVLEKKEDFPYAEERRLFYVAITRAKKYVWLVVLKENRSVFVEELERQFERELKEEKYKCPQCGRGKTEYKMGRYGDFIRCNYCGFSKSLSKKA